MKQPYSQYRHLFTNIFILLTVILISVFTWIVREAIHVEFFLGTDIWLGFDDTSAVEITAEGVEECIKLLTIGTIYCDWH